MLSDYQALRLTIEFAGATRASTFLSSFSTPLFLVKTKPGGEETRTPGDLMSNAVTSGIKWFVIALEQCTSLNKSVDLIAVAKIYVCYAMHHFMVIEYDKQRRAG